MFDNSNSVKYSYRTLNVGIDRMNVGRIISVTVAIIFAIAAVICIVYPGLGSRLPGSYKSDFYLNSITGAAATFGSLAGFLFLLSSYLSQQMEVRRLQQSEERKRSQEFLMRFFEAYTKAKADILYMGQYKSDHAIGMFYTNVKETVHRNLGSDGASKNDFEDGLKRAIDTSQFQKGGTLNLYWRSVKTVMQYIEKSETPEMVAYWELMLSQEEMTLILYISNHYFDSRPAGFDYLVRCGFLGSLESKNLIYSHYGIPNI